MPQYDHNHLPGVRQVIRTCISNIPEKNFREKTRLIKTFPATQESPLFPIIFNKNIFKGVQINEIYL
jgi:hypothetical protein